MVTNLNNVLSNWRLDGECWIWTKSTNQHGYGRAMITIAPKETKLMAVHRLAYEHHIGPVPSGMQVCHTCDNPGCINPDHLWLGTQGDNMRDMVNKRRHAEQRLTDQVEHFKILMKSN